jgi:hypothetical protein
MSSSARKATDFPEPERPLTIISTMWQLPWHRGGVHRHRCKLCYSGRGRIHHRETVTLSGLEVTPTGYHSVMIW